MFNGGYLMVSKTDTDLYKKLNNALNLGKPILFYEDATTCYYIDTIALSGDDIVLTKGGKTITITDANVVTESGSISIHKYYALITGKDTNANLYDIHLTLITTKENPTINNFINTLGYDDNDAYVIVRLSDYVEEDNKVEFKSANGSDIVLETDVEFTITKEF